MRSRSFGGRLSALASLALALLVFAPGALAAPGGGGNLAALDEAYTLPIVGSTGAVAVEISGTWSGTIIAQVSIDAGTTWTTVDLYNIGTKSSAASTTANGSFRLLNTAGASQIRLKMSAYSSGTAAVTILVTDAFSAEGGTADTELPAATGSLRPTSLAETMTAVPTVTAVLLGADTGSNVFRPAHVDSAGDVQVDLASALPAGTASIGHVTAHAGEPFAVGVTNTVAVSGDVTVHAGEPFAVGVTNTVQAIVHAGEPLAVGVTNTVTVSGDVTVHAGEPLAVGVTNTVTVAGTVGVSGTVPVFVGNPVPVGITNTVTVTVGSALPAGTNSIGEVVVHGGATPVPVGVTNTVTVAGTVAVSSLTSGNVTVHGGATPVPVGVTNTVTVTVGSALPAGTNSIGEVVVHGGATPVPVGVTNTVTTKPSGTETWVMTTATTTSDTENLIAATAGRVLVGFSARESAATAAAATFRIGNHALVGSATAFLFVELNANESIPYVLTGNLAIPNGACIDFIAGTFDATLVYKDP